MSKSIVNILLDFRNQSRLNSVNKNLGFDGGLVCAIECVDLENSIAWYRKVLGFEPVLRMEEIGWCELKTSVANVQIGLSQVEKPSVRGGATMTFGVENLENAHEELIGHDVKFDGAPIVYPDMVKLITFFDPDGNKLMLYENLVSA